MTITTSEFAHSRGDATKLNILAAARTLFIEHGYSGTSMGKIASLAKVNHSLIFHHFENKQTLWQEVKKRILLEGREVIDILPSTDLSLKEFLFKLIDNGILFFGKNPDIVRMLSWQRLETGRNTNIGLSYSEETQRWMEVCERYKERGEVNTQYKTEFVMTFILSVVSSLALDPNVFIAEPEDRKAYIEFCVDFLYRGLK